jgi:hypothetical protein
LQPMENASEMINARPYLHAAAVKDFDLVYHGTYWECAPRILATREIGKSAMLERWRAYPRRMRAPRARLRDNEAISWQKLRHLL